MKFLKAISVEHTATSAKLSTLRLIVLGLTHTIIDHYAAFLTPIHLILASQAGMDMKSAPWLISIFVLTSSFAQPGFGFISDRFGGRWLLLPAPAAAGLFLGGLLGIDRPELLFVAIFLGSLAIAAFHPTGATLARNLGRLDSSFTTSVFIAAGPIGLAMGPLVVTNAAKADLPFSALIIPGLASTLLLFLFFPKQLIQGPRSRPTFHFLDAVSGRWPTIAKLICISSIRAFVTVGLTTAFTVILSERLGKREALPYIGLWTSILLGCGALGGVLLALILKPRYEKAALMGTVLLAGPLLGMLPHSHGMTSWVLLASGGFFLGATNPLNVALGQRVVPKGAGLASALMLGFSWGLGGTFAPHVFAASAARYGPETGATIIASFLLMALLASCLLTQEELQIPSGKITS